MNESIFVTPFEAWAYRILKIVFMTATLGLMVGIPAAWFAWEASHDLWITAIVLEVFFLSTMGFVTRMVTRIARKRAADGKEVEYEQGKGDGSKS